MAATVLTLRGAAFGYGRTAVVEGVDLEVRAGDFLGVAGPNGAGKTTLLRGVLGLSQPLAGSVERAAGVSIGYVPQRDGLDAVYPISVEEVVLLGAAARLRGWRRRPSRDDRRLARASLERVGLGSRRRALFSSLSGGQRQRVLFARALVERPRLCVLDEPTTGIDLPTVELIFALLRELREEQEVAILLVSHELDLLRDEVEDVLWVDGGRVARHPAHVALAPSRLAQLRGPGHLPRRTS